MVGYSDSGKDTGYVGSTSGRCYNAQEQLAAQARRGGHRARALPRPRRLAVARRRAHLPRDPGPARGHGARAGSGSPSRARRSPPATPTPELAERSLEQTVSRRAAGHRAAEPAGPRRVARGDGAALGALARALPRAGLRRPGVPALLRPGRADRRALRSSTSARGRRRAQGQRGVESLRAIPWVFAWTQNRLLLPSWYGAGTALAAGDLELQREMWRDWPFFRGLIGTLEMALFKSDLGVAERYLSLVDEDIAERFWDRPARRVRQRRRARADDHRPGPAAGRDARAAARGSSTATRGSIRSRTCRSSSCAACARAARRRARRCWPRSPGSRRGCATPVSGRR